MKKPLQHLLFIFLFIFGANLVSAQTDRQQEIYEIEADISEYIADNISTYKIPAEDLRQLEKATRFENQTVEKQQLEY